MKYFLLLLFFIFPTPSFSMSQTTVTYELALQKSLEHSLQKKKAENQKKQASIQNELATYDNDPKLTTEAGYIWKYKKAETEAQKSTEQTREQAYGLSLTLPIYDFGRQSANEDMANFDEKAATVAEEEVIESIIWQTAKLFLSSIATKKLEIVAQDQLKVSKSKLAEQKRNYEMGLRSESDVVSTEVELGKSEIAYDKAVDDARLALIKLLVSMGLEDGESQEFVINATSGNLKTPPEIFSIISKWKNGSLTASERKREFQRNGLDAELKKMNSQKYPSLQSVISGEEVGTLNPVRPQATAQVQLSWNIPWNGMYSDEKRLINEKKENLIWQDKIEKRDRLEQLKTARLALEAAEKQWKGLSLQQVLVKKQKDLITKRYESGKASLLELTTAETNLISLENDKIRLSSDAIQAALTLAEALSIKTIDILWK